MTADLSHRLSSGITIGEAAQRAEKWWGEWRGAVNRQFAMEKTERVRSGVGVPLMKFMNNEVDYSVGNILLGAPWEELTAVEKATVTKYWHDGVLLQGNTDGRIMATAGVRPWRRFRAFHGGDDIEAMQWIGTNFDEMKAFTADLVTTELYGSLQVGGHNVDLHDWVARTEDGVFTIIGPGLFDENYDEIA